MLFLCQYVLLLNILSTPAVFPPVLSSHMCTIVDMKLNSDCNCWAYWGLGISGVWWV